MLLQITGAALILGACSAPENPRCGDGFCRPDTECDVVHGLCITPQQRTVCDGQADGVPCEVGGNGDSHCDRGVCLPGFCGDGVVDIHEECDDGAANSDSLADACRTDCQLARCGDGTVDASEICDDGNTLDGDGCSATCTVEP